MCHIMEKLHKYVPTITQERTVNLPNGETFKCDDTKMWELLMGGDQLTVARCRGAAAIRSSHVSSTDRLEGLVPVVEDWHSRMTFLKVLIICHSHVHYTCVHV